MVEPGLAIHASLRSLVRSLQRRKRSLIGRSRDWSVSAVLSPPALIDAGTHLRRALFGPELLCRKTPANGALLGRSLGCVPTGGRIKPSDTPTLFRAHVFPELSAAHTTAASPPQLPVGSPTLRQPLGGLCRRARASRGCFGGSPRTFSTAPESLLPAFESDEDMLEPHERTGGESSPIAFCLPPHVSPTGIVPAWTRPPLFPFIPPQLFSFIPPQLFPFWHTPVHPFMSAAFPLDSQTCSGRWIALALPSPAVTARALTSTRARWWHPRRSSATACASARTASSDPTLHLQTASGCTRTWSSTAIP